MQSKILIVENDFINAVDIRFFLQNKGFEVVSIASDGKEAIKKAEELKPYLILMNIMLKGEIDGIKAAYKISMDLNIPIIFLNSNSDKNLTKRTELTESKKFLIKTITSKGLSGSK